MTKTPATILGIVVGAAVGFGLDILLTQTLFSGYGWPLDLSVIGGGAVAGGAIGYSVGSPGSSAPRLTK